MKDIRYTAFLVTRTEPDVNLFSLKARAKRDLRTRGTTAKRDLPLPRAKRILPAYEARTKRDLLQPHYGYSDYAGEALLYPELVGMFAASKSLGFFWDEILERFFYVPISSFALELITFCLVRNAVPFIATIVVCTVVVEKYGSQSLARA